MVNDPSTSTYWNHRQSEVRALCHQFGDPGLMLTFTFVNRWPEVSEIERDARDLFHHSLDIRFCPAQTMQIWRSRFHDVKAKNLQKLIAVMGFESVAHYVWRLEFQARGTPHVHALIWLSQPLDTDIISHSMFGTAPVTGSAAILRLILGHLQSLDTVSRLIQSFLTPPDSDSLRQFMNCDFAPSEMDCAREHLRVHLPQLNQQQRTVFDRISRLFGLDISTNMFISGAAGARNHSSFEPSKPTALPSICPTSPAPPLGSPPS